MERFAWHQFRYRGSGAGAGLIFDACVQPHRLSTVALFLPSIFSADAGRAHVVLVGDEERRQEALQLLEGGRMLPVKSGRRWAFALAGLLLLRFLHEGLNSPDNPRRRRGLSDIGVLHIDG